MCGFSLSALFCISELFSDKSNTHEFVDLVKELALPGELTLNRSYDFEFMQVEKPYESYMGANVRLRYSNMAAKLMANCKFYILLLLFTCIHGCAYTCFSPT